MNIFRKKPAEPIRQARFDTDEQSYMFRRSRTLTGSLSDGVRAANEQRSDLRSERLKHHDLRSHRRKVAGWLLGSLGIVVGIGLLLSQYISDVTIISGTIPASDHAIYRSAISDYLSNHPTERFRFSLDQAQLLRSVQHQFPEVAKITISEGGFFQPSNAELLPRTPLVAWTIRDKTYYIDEHGVAFERLIGQVPTLVVEDKTGIDPNDAGAVASERMIRYVGRLVALVHESGLTVERVQLPAGTSREIDLLLEGRGYPIKTNLDRDPAGQAADVKHAVEYFDTNRITPQYVDVRVGSKAYYR